MSLIFMSTKFADVDVRNHKIHNPEIIGSSCSLSPAHKESSPYGEGSTNDQTHNRRWVRWLAPDIYNLLETLRDL